MQACRPTKGLLPELLVQIRRRYTANVGSVCVMVESDAGAWTAHVVEHGRSLYSARRCSLTAAQAAATEFVTFWISGIVGAIGWTECW